LKLPYVPAGKITVIFGDYAPVDALEIKPDITAAVDIDEVHAADRTAEARRVLRLENLA
jgi:hypothetical protein